MNALTTPLCATLGIDVPIAQAPIGSATTPALAAAVCEAGGLGTLALTWVSAQEAQLRVRQTRQLTDRPFAVNLVLYAGQSVVLTEMPAPAAYIVAAIARQAADVLGQAAASVGQR